MVELINADYPWMWAGRLEHVTPGATVGRPHIGDALVAAGHVPDRPAAFARILGNRAYRAGGCSSPSESQQLAERQPA